MLSMEIGVISATRKVKIQVAEVENAADCDRVTRGEYSAVRSYGPGIQPTPKQKS